MPAPRPPDWTITERRAIGRHIQRLREGAGLTQDEVVRRADLDRRTLQRIEYGDVDPHLSRLQVIARALGVTLAELVRVAEAPR